MRIVSTYVRPLEMSSDLRRFRRDFRIIHVLGDNAYNSERMEKPMSRICWASCAESSAGDCFIGGGLAGRSGSGRGAGEGEFVMGVDVDGGCKIDLSADICEESGSMVSIGVRFSNRSGESKDDILAELLLSPA